MSMSFASPWRAKELAPDVWMCVRTTRGGSLQYEGPILKDEVLAKAAAHRKNVWLRSSLFSTIGAAKSTIVEATAELNLVEQEIGS